MTRRPRPLPLPSSWLSRRDLLGASEPSPAAQRRLQRGAALLLLASAALLGSPQALRAGVRFENCVQGSDGSISCDTVPTGNTYLNDKDAQYGLLQQASPGWAEFNPYQGYDEDFGGGDG